MYPIVVWITIRIALELVMSFNSVDSYNYDDLKRGVLPLQECRYPQLAVGQFFLSNFISICNRLYILGIKYRLYRSI